MNPMIGLWRAHNPMKGVLSAAQHKVRNYRVETMMNSHSGNCGKLAQKTCCKIAKVIKSSHGLMINDTRVEGRYAATRVVPESSKGVKFVPPKKPTQNRPGG